MLAEMLPGQAVSGAVQSRPLLVPDVRCATCTSPNRQQIDDLLQAGDSATVVKNHLASQGIGTAAKSSLDRHKRHHLTAPGDAEGIVGLAVAQGGRQLQRGKIKMTATALASFLRLQREIQAQGREKASEEMAARAVNYLFIALRQRMSADEFHAFKDEIWDGLLEVVRGEVMAAQPAPETPLQASAV